MCDSYATIVINLLRKLYKHIYGETDIHKAICQSKIGKIRFLPVQSPSSCKENY